MHGPTTGQPPLTGAWYQISELNQILSILSAARSFEINAPNHEFKSTWKIALHSLEPR